MLPRACLWIILYSGLILAAHSSWSRALESHRIDHWYLSGSGWGPGPTWQDVRLADADGDHVLDVLAVDNQGTLTWYRNDGAHSFTAQGAFRQVDGYTDMAVADLDGDGRDDLVLAGNSLAYALGVLSPPLTLFAGKHSAVSVVDFDGDGAADILACGGASGVPTSLFISDGGRPPSYLRWPITDASSSSATVGDFDGDLDLDVAIALTGGVYWFENLGGSPPPFSDHLVWNEATSSVAALDVDGDGDIDILSTAAGKVSWHENLGGSPPEWKLLELSPSRCLRVWAIDVDGDGQLDPVALTGIPREYLNPPSPLRWYKRISQSPLAWQQQVISSSAARGFGARDTDGDGLIDFAAESFSKTVYEDIAHQQFFLVSESIDWYRTVAGPNVIATEFADFSGDGVVSPGETGTLRVTVRNDEPDELTGAVVAVASTQPLVSFTGAGAELATLAAGATAEAEFPFTTDTAADCGAQTRVDWLREWNGHSTRLAGPTLAFGVYRDAIARVAEAPGISIPDNDQAGVVRTLSVMAPNGRCGEVWARVEITHTYRGDLLVTLRHPSGVTRTLFNSPGTPGENLSISVQFWDFLDLAPGGDYTLTVVDRQPGDAGTLVSWSLQVDYEGWQCPAWQPEQVLEPLLGIPLSQNNLVPDVNGDGLIDAADVVRLVGPPPQ
jgi:hypothetical protein